MIFTHFFFFPLAKQRQFLHPSRRYEIHVQRQRQCNAEVFSLGRRLTFSSPSFIPSILFLIFFLLLPFDFQLSINPHYPISTLKAPVNPSTYV